MNAESASSGLGYCVSGIAYSLGTNRPIEHLTTVESVSPEVLASLRQNGLRSFREDERGIPEMCVASALATLERTGIAVEQIRTIVLASSNSDAMVSDEDETALFAALHAAGFTRARVVGLTLQSCSASGDALSVASALANQSGGDDPVLVVVFAQRKKMSRLGPQGNLVFSDGAVSCLVSRRGDFELCAIESITNAGLGAQGRTGNMAQFEGGMRELGGVSKRAFEKARLKARDIRAFFGTNAGIGQLKLMAQAARVPLDRIHYDDLEQNSHVHSCDGLIGLHNYSERHELAPGDAFLLLSWSPHVFCSIVLRWARSKSVAADP